MVKLIGTKAKIQDFVTRIGSRQATNPSKMYEDN